MENISREYGKEKSARALLFVVLFANFFRSIGISVVDIGLPTFIISLSGTLMSYGLVVGIFMITQSIFQFPMAAFSDKFGRKKIIMLGIFIYTLGTFLCYLTENVIQLIIFRAIQGAGAYSSILQAIIGDLFDEGERGKGMSYYSLSFTLAYFGGISIGGYISYYFGFRNIFLISGVFATLSGVLILFFFKDENEKTKNLDNSGNLEKKKSLGFSDIKILLKNPQYEITMLINCMRWLVFGGIVAYMVWMMEIQFNLNQIQTSYFLIIIVAFYILFLIISGKLVDRFDSKRVMLLGQVIIVSFSSLFFIVHITNNLPLYIIASLLSGIGLGMYETSGNTLLLKKIGEIDSGLKGAGFGISNTIGFFFGAIGPIIFSLMGEISLFLPYYFIFFYILACFLISYKFIKS
ncbi:MAG: MFS transporter [Promethearchaeota archaeon]